MERYEDSFLQAGFNSVDQLAQITTQSVPIASFLICADTYLFQFTPPGHEVRELASLLQLATIS